MQETGGPVRATRLEDDTLLHVVIDRPRGNVLDMQTMEALRETLLEHLDDGHLRLVVLQGAGGNFSYGASVEEHLPETAPRMLELFHDLIREVAAFPVPIAALVEGKCLGGGFELALVCHLLFATSDARFGCPEVRLGVFPPVLAAVGALRLGGALAERLILTGDVVGPEVLEAAGVLTGRLGGDEPFEALRAWYRERLRPLSAFALRQAAAASRHGSRLLESLHGSLDALERRYLQKVLPSHDGVEGIRAFMERRKPHWEDR